MLFKFRLNIFRYVTCCINKKKWFCRGFFSSFKASPTISANIKTKEKMSQVQKIRRPLDLLDFHQIVFKFFGTFDIENASNFVKFLMTIHTILYQILFTQIGFVLFTMFLLVSTSAKETLQALFVVFAYLNAAFKALTFYMNRKKLVELWSKLSDPDCEAKNHIEDE